MQKNGCLISILLFVAIYVSNQAWERSRIQQAKHRWQSTLNAAHLVGTDKEIVFRFLRRNHLEYNNSNGFFGYTDLQNIHELNGGETYTAFVSDVAHTFDYRLVQDWVLHIEFQFDKNGKLVRYAVEPDSSGI